MLLSATHETEDEVQFGKHLQAQTNSNHCSATESMRKKQSGLEVNRTASQIIRTDRRSGGKSEKNLLSIPTKVWIPQSYSDDLHLWYLEDISSKASTNGNTNNKK